MGKGGDLCAPLCTDEMGFSQLGLARAIPSAESLQSWHHRERQLIDIEFRCPFQMGFAARCLNRGVSDTIFEVTVVNAVIVRKASSRRYGTSQLSNHTVNN